MQQRTIAVHRLHRNHVCVAKCEVRCVCSQRFACIKVWTKKMSPMWEGEEWIQIQYLFSSGYTNMHIHYAGRLWYLVISTFHQTEDHTPPPPFLDSKIGPFEPWTEEKLTFEGFIWLILQKIPRIWSKNKQKQVHNWHHTNIWMNKNLQDLLDKHCFLETRHVANHWTPGTHLQHHVIIMWCCKGVSLNSFCVTL